MNMSLGKLWELVMDREALHAVIHGVRKNRTELSERTELKHVGAMAVPWEDPNWDYQEGRPGWAACNHMAACLIVGLPKAGHKAINFDKLQEITQFGSVQFTHSVVSDSLRPHESQHTRPPCPSPTARVHSDSRPSSPWCHPAISSVRGRPLLLLPPIPPSIRVFSNESTLRMR